MDTALLFCIKNYQRKIKLGLVVFLNLHMGRSIGSQGNPYGRIWRAQMKKYDETELEAKSLIEASESEWVTLNTNWIWGGDSH